MIMDYKIRVARKEDAEKLLKIYAPYVENTAITFEYTVPTKDEFKKRIENTLKKYPYIAAERNDEILGYAYAGELYHREAYMHSAETSIYVARNGRGRGIGTVLYDELEKLLLKQGITNLYACIAYAETEDEFLTNGSVRFHEKRGFSIAGKFNKCGYKFNRWYDVVWMEKQIAKPQIPAQPFFNFAGAYFGKNTV